MFLSKGGINRKAVAQVTEWVRARLEIGRKKIENIQIFVAETECREVGCVPLEVLVILIGPTQRWPGKILKPIVEVTKDDVDGLDFPDSVEEWIPDVAPPPIEEVQVSAPATVVQMRPTVGVSSESSLMPTATAYDPSSSSISSSSDSGNREPTAGMSVASSAVRPPRPPAVVQAADGETGPRARHEKGGVRARGCPCCDPDNIENIIDKILFLDTPP